MSTGYHIVLALSHNADLVISRESSLCQPVNINLIKYTEAKNRSCKTNLNNFYACVLIQVCTISKYSGHLF